MNVNNMGGYFIKSMVVDKCGKDNDLENKTYVSAHKRKLAERNWVIGNSQIWIESTRIIKIYSSCVHHFTNNVIQNNNT